MLKLGEKIIYEIPNNFELIGLTKYSIRNKKLAITNLGNIIIVEDNEKNGENTVSCIYNYSKYRKKLTASLKDGKVIIVGNELPFLIVENKVPRETMLCIELEIELKDYNYICKNQREFIFELKDNITIIEIDKSIAYQGDIRVEADRFIFTYERHSLDIFFEDIEKYLLEGKQLSLKGYFYLENKGAKYPGEIVREISIFNNNIKRIISYELDEIVSENNKIGNLPEEAKLVYCQLEGTIDNKDYEKNPTILVKYNEDIILIDKKSKTTIIKLSKKECFKLKLDNVIVLCDKSNIFRLHTNKSNIEYLDLESFKDIEFENIGYTEDNLPFFIKHDDNGLKILKSLDQEILTIKNLDILGLNIDTKFKSLNRNFRRVELKFKHCDSFKKIILNIKKEITDELMSDIFVSSKSELIEQVPMKIIYKNWAKSMTDVIIFNFFGNIYKLNLEINDIVNEGLHDGNRVIIANKIYNEIQNQKRNLNIISSYMPKEIIEAEEELLKRVDKAINPDIIKCFKQYFDHLSFKIARNLNEIENSLSRVSFAMSIIRLRKDNVRKLTGEQSERLTVYVDQAISNLEHFIENMYPYYIQKADKEFFKLFSLLGSSYNGVEEDWIKVIFLKRISKINIFKDKYVPDNDELIVKDVIEQIYAFIGKDSYRKNKEFYFMDKDDFGNQQVDTTTGSNCIWGENLDFMYLGDKEEQEEDKYLQVSLNKLKQEQSRKISVSYNVIEQDHISDINNEIETNIEANVNNDDEAIYNIIDQSNDDKEVSEVKQKANCLIDGLYSDIVSVE